MRRFVFTVLLCACVSAPAPQHEPSTKSAAPAVTPSPVPPSEPKPTAERMAADTPRSAPAGVTFTAPAGWSVLPQDPAPILEPPEADSHIAVVGVQAKDSNAAAPVARTWLLRYDPELLDIEGLELWRRGDRRPPRGSRLQACYDGADLDDVARELGMRREERVRRHVESEHVVSFLGFAPGFAYMTGGFHVPRLRTPRVRVPAGSLAVADGYAGLYPAGAPGGWG